MNRDNFLEKVVIIDFGSQFTQLIARKVREVGVYSEIINFKQVKNFVYLWRPPIPLRPSVDS